MTIPSVRTLFINTGYDPYPPSAGAALRDWQHINIMRKFGSVGFFSVFRGNSNGQTIPGVDLRYHYNLAEVKRSLWEKLELQFWWLNPTADTLTTGRYAKVVAQKLKEVLKEFQPDLVIAEMYGNRYLATVKRYGCRLILDQHNVNGIWLKDFYSARCLIGKRKLTIQEKIDLSRTKLIELNLLRQVDQVWMCSDFDDKLLQGLYGNFSNTRVVPNGIDIAYYERARFGECTLPEGLEKKQRTILYCGLLSYSPNSLAVELLINQIYPQLRQVYPDCRLLVVGRNPTQWMLDAAEQDSGITVTGAVPDMRPYFAAANVMVVPLYHGSGTRLKILEAFGAGLPVVSTAKGAEGLKVTDGEHLLIREEVDAIAVAVRQIWSDPSLEKKLTSSAFELVQAEYSWSAIGKSVESAVAELF